MTHSAYELLENIILGEEPDFAEDQLLLEALDLAGRWDNQEEKWDCLVPYFKKVLVMRERPNSYETTRV